MSTLSLSSSSSLMPQIPSNTGYDDFKAPPMISKGIIVGFGLLLFVLAMIWPPLILLVTFVASVVIPYSYCVNDNGDNRRMLMQHFNENDPVAIQRKKAFPDEHVKVTSNFWKNPRGLLQHVTILVPKNEEIKAVVCYCHGYIDNPNYTKAPELGYFCKTGGLAIILVEYEGHGQSDGALGLVSDFDLLVHFTHLAFQNYLVDFPGKTAFLMGESMGGAVAYTMIQKYPQYSGVIFMCPMCKIADEMMPPDIVVQIFRKIAGPGGTATMLGYLPIAPAADVQELAFKDPAKRKIISRHPAIYTRMPRLATAREMLDVTKRISESLSDFKAPFLGTLLFQRE
jgi:acylglycerol lipase